MKGQMKGVSYVVILIALSILSLRGVTCVSAIVPQITETVVWNSGSDTVLNVTIYHSPETSLHYVDSVDVDVDGEVQAFPVDVQPSTTFTVQCNVGPLEGTPVIKVQAHCTVDGYSAWIETSKVQEYPWFLILLFVVPLAVAVAAVAFWRMRRQKTISSPALLMA